MAQNIYDNPAFFEGYGQLGRPVEGLAGAAEWPAKVVGLEVSEKMLERAVASISDPVVTCARADLEQQDLMALVVFRLVVHLAAGHREADVGYDNRKYR